MPFGSTNLPEGQYRIVEGKREYDTLQLLVDVKESDALDGVDTIIPPGGDNVQKRWRSLYIWRRDEVAEPSDLECANWYMCTYPTARFTSTFFVSRMILPPRSAVTRNQDDERHHILNDTYVVRKGYGSSSVVETQPIHDKAQLLHILETVFDLCFSRDEESHQGLDKFLCE